MVVAFDADVLILLLQPSIDPPTDPGTQRPVEYVSERLAQLVADLTERDAGVIVPAPALAEVLVVPGADALELLKVIDKQAVFRIEPFRAARCGRGCGVDTGSTGSGRQEVRCGRSVAVREDGPTDRRRGEALRRGDDLFQ